MEGRVPAWEKTIALLAAPAAWTLHLFASYFVVALDCTSEWNGGGIAVAIITVVLFVAALAAGVFALRRWRLVQQARSWEHALNEAGGDHGLMMLVGVMLAMLFALLILLNGVAPFLVPVCAP